MSALPDYLEREVQWVFSAPGRIQQHEVELREFLRRCLEDLKPQRTVELGSWRGLNAALLSLVTSGVTLSIDNQDYGGKEEAMAMADRHPNQSMLIFRQADARSMGTVIDTVGLFGADIDLLFLDDGHCIDEVTDEFNKWKPLVRKGGWIVCHDINPDANQCAPGVHPAICQAHVHWATVQGEKEEIVFRGTPPGPGIGILRV